VGQTGWLTLASDGGRLELGTPGWHKGGNLRRAILTDVNLRFSNPAWGDLIDAKLSQVNMNTIDLSWVVMPDGTVHVEFNLIAYKQLICCKD